MGTMVAEERGGDEFFDAQDGHEDLSLFGIGSSRAEAGSSAALAEPSHAEDAEDAFEDATEGEEEWEEVDEHEQGQQAEQEGGSEPAAREPEEALPSAAAVSSRDGGDVRAEREQGDSDSTSEEEEDDDTEEIIDHRGPLGGFPDASEVPPAPPAAPVEEMGNVLSTNEDPDSEEYKENLAAADAAKAEGNECFKSGDLDTALLHYERAISLAPKTAKEIAVYYSNRAACHMKKKDWTEACRDCSAALRADQQYLKARLRRMTAFEELDELDRAYEDANTIIKQDPGNVLAKRAIVKLEPVVLERREKMKEEMLGKLKDLGNTVLGKFGMSLDNFKAVKDPATGSYSINFSQ